MAESDSPLDHMWEGSTRIKLPDTRRAITHKFTIADHEGYFNVGLYPDGQPGELFIVVSKEGSTFSGLLDGIGILVSMCLQHRVPLRTITSKLRDQRFEPQGRTLNKDIPFASSVLDYIAHWLEHEFIPGEHDRLTISVEDLAIIDKPCPSPGCVGTVVILGAHRVGCNLCQWERRA